MKSREKPDIIFITTDTQGREMVSSYVDRPGVETPNIDRLGAEGIVFENAFTTCPLCTPARSSWYTGLYPSRNGACGNKLGIRRPVPMLADLLKERGYQAHHIGKWHLDAAGYAGGGQGDGGFSPETWYDLNNFYDEVGSDGPNRFGGWNRGLKDIEYCYGHRVADRAIDLLKKRDRDENRNPIFLSVAFDEPHGPYISPPPFRGRHAQEDIYKPPTFMADMTAKPRIQQECRDYLAEKRDAPGEYPGYYHRYYDCNTYVDHEIGRVLAAVDKYLKDDCIVIYTSDHGDHLGAFGLCAKGPTMYDHTVAVPLIIRAPGLVSGGERAETPVSTIDLWPTFIELAGIDGGQFSQEDGYSGSSLLPVLSDPDKDFRREVFIEYNRFGIHHHQVRGFFPIRCIRTREWKLSINLFDRDELYHLASDPHEEQNLIADEGVANIRNELHDRLLAWQNKHWDIYRGPIWAERSWRKDYEHDFTGLVTTGYFDEWEFGSLNQ